MRNIALLSLLTVPAALATPSILQDVVDGISGYVDLSSDVFGGLVKGIEHLVQGVEASVEKKAEHWAYLESKAVVTNGLPYEQVSHSSFSDYQLRVTEPKLCDPSVKQYSGYLDITTGKHLFFWFFESRTAPKDAPLVLWLNGGPGCSSSTGLLFELGPCNIAQDGANTTYNKHGWNSHANMIFLDQPVNVGYSYSDDGSTVSTSPVAGEDVYAFLELFLARFPKYAQTPFHLAAESYGGTYAPNIASVIHRENKALALRPDAALAHINLASVILANGLTDPLVQMGSVADYACDGPFPMFSDPDGAECQSLRSKIPTCQRLVKACYDYNSRFTCVPAALYCNTQLYGPLQQTGRNLYDVRKSCDRSKDGDLCYKQMEWIDTWMNTDSNKRALGVNPDLKFQSCNMEVNQAFMFQGDGMHNSGLLLPQLVNEGVKLLVYAGNADSMCNYIGNERWVNELDTQFIDEFQASKPLPWVTIVKGKVAGEVRTAGGDGSTSGNVTFVNVFDAGHMVPFDQPEAALDMFTRWIMDVPLTL